MAPSDFDSYMELRETFWEDVTPRGDCWLWNPKRKGRVDDQRYGYTWLTFRGAKKQLLAHRVAYLLAYGSYPDEYAVCHTCDTPRCIFWGHLFLGTDTDNTQDMWSKGRGVVPIVRRGEYNPNARLTAETVTAIKRMRQDGATFTQIADAFGVARNTAWMIVQGRQWSHVP